MVSGISHDLAVAGVVGSFNRNDTIADFRVLFAQIFGEFCLRAGGSNDQDFAGIADGVHHLREKFLVGRGIPAADRVGLVEGVSWAGVDAQSPRFRRTGRYGRPWLANGRSRRWHGNVLSCSCPVGPRSAGLRMGLFSA